MCARLLDAAGSVTKSDEEEKEYSDRGEDKHTSRQADRAKQSNDT
jgi:hypothetical protein